MHTTTCASGIGEAMPECAIRLKVWECCIGCIQCRDLGNPVWCNLAPKGSRLRFITPRAFGVLAAALASRERGSGARNLISGVWTPVFVLGEGTMALCGMVAMWTCVPCSQGHPAYFSSLAACVFPMGLLFPGTKAPHSPQRRLLDFRKR